MQRTVLKRISIILLCLALCLTTGCAASNNTPTEPPTQAPTEAPTDAPTEAPTEAPTAPPPSDKGEAVAALAKSLIGTPYALGGDGPDTFDTTISDTHCCFDEYLYFNETGNDAAKLFYEEFLNTIPDSNFR